MKLIDVLHALIQNRERREAEEVELHETDVLNVMLIELADRVFRLTVLAIERTEIGERTRSDQHTAGVHAKVSRDAFKRFGVTHELLILLISVDLFLEVRLHLLRKFERNVLSRRRRDELRNFIHLAVRHAEYTADVTHHSLRAHGAEGRDLAHSTRAVLVLHVLNRFVAVPLTEVHVEVRHRHAFRVQEAFEKEVIVQRIHIRDPQRIGDE